jgi:hypothetical protein
MESARAVITRDGDFLVVSFYGIPVYSLGGSMGPSKHEGEDLALVVVLPLDAQLVRAKKNGEMFDAAMLARDVARIVSGK